MVKFVGYKAVDNRDLSELGYFQNIKKNLDRSGEGKSFDATKGDIDMHVTGKGMLFVFKKPTSGTMKTVDVKVGGSEKYYLSGLDIKIRKMKDFFKGDYESKIFGKNDKITGSNEGDTLAGYNGKDTIKGGNGADNIGGGKGDDKLWGEAGNDVIAGDQGNDFLNGGDGTNYLSGGKGKDIFQFSSQLSQNNTSSITDFEIGKDKIELVKSVFPDLTGSGTLAAGKFVLASDYAGQDAVVVYNKATGGLSYALDSNNLIEFGAVGANLNLSHTDIILA